MVSESEAKQQSKTMVALSLLERRIGEAVEEIENLSSRLEPIMQASTPVPMPKDSGKVEQAPSGLRMKLITMTDRIERTLQVLQDIKVRLEV